jgi:PST family polysaccharide transporter
MGGGFLASTVTSPSEMAEYGSADRLNQLSLQAIIAVGNALSPWVAVSRGAQFGRRARVALVAHTVLGVLGCAAIILLGPWVTAVLFGSRFAISVPTAAGFGAYFLAVSVHTVLARHILITRGVVRPVLVGTIGGAVVGTPAVLFGALTYGASGAAAGLAIGETMVCLLQLGPAVRVLRRHSRMPAGPAAPATHQD